MPEQKEMVTITIDGKAVTVPKGTNLIEAAKTVGIEIPFYCYHRHLSVAGNCRMCQVQVEGQAKLTIACNTGANNGMVVHTQETSKEVCEAQRATLEFLLINHPLDCTVCDQAGHCKLQDYYYDYNSQASRFTEDKVHKVKAEVLGPEVVYDGERCILCTRCVRFCDEVTGTGELGVFNRGDRSVIGIDEKKILDNPLSGTVVDLCPVGALTHRPWRFKTRIWYTTQVDSICTGCSTGCNVKVAERDGQIVHVKARLNSDVNKEWLCDEGRYGFERFQHDCRLTAPALKSGEEYKVVKWEEALRATEGLQGKSSDDAAVFLSPMLTLEEVFFSVEFASQVMGVKADSSRIAMQLRMRNLSEVEKVLVSPDYAPNARAAGLFGIGSAGSDFRESLQSGYENLLSILKKGGVRRLLLVGDDAVLDSDVDGAFWQGLSTVECSVALTPRGVKKSGKIGHEAHMFCRVVFPGRTVNEKNGVMINRDSRFQRLHASLTPPFGSFAEWMLIRRIAESLKKDILPKDINDERALFRQMVAKCPQFAGLTLGSIGEFGVMLGASQEGQRVGESAGA